MIKRIKIAIYARYSSDNQRDESIDAQVRAIEAYCEKNGYAIVKVYADRAKSATSDKRPEFQKMIADSELGIFDAVIVHKLDRFSRDKYDAITYKRKLKKNGIKLLSVTENLDGSPESIILESVIEGMAEYYSKNLAREVMKENALKCRHTGGRPPLGYDVDPETKLLVINEYEAEIIKLIFSMYIDGHGYSSMIDTLNAKGYRTKLGSTFAKNSLHDIIGNEKYSGVYVYNKKSSKNFDGKYNSHKIKDDDEIIKIEGGCPVIISPDEFAKAQLRMANNKKTSGSYKAKEIYLLSGLIYCGSCGHAMHGNRRKDGKKKEIYYISYRCGNKVSKRQCDNREIRRDDIEDFILHELETKLFNNIPILVERLNEHQKSLIVQYERETKLLTDELQDKQQKLDNIVKAISMGLFNESLKEEITKLEEEKNSVEIRIKELQCKHPHVEITEETIHRLLSSFHQYVKERNIPECKKFIEHYVDKVLVFPDRVEVTYTVAASMFNECETYRFTSEVELKNIHLHTKRSA